MNTQQILLTCKLRLRFWILIQATTVLQCTFSSASSLNTTVPISKCHLIARYSISIVNSTISSHFNMNFFVKSKICPRFHKEISVWDFAYWSSLKQQWYVCVMSVNEGQILARIKCFLYQNPHGNWWKNSSGAIMTSNMVTLSKWRSES